MLYQGSCHCGAVRFSFEAGPIDKGLRCNCSLCSRKGAMMTPEPIPAALFTIETDEGVLGLYQFGAKTAEHYFCKQCGIYSFHVPGRFPGHYRANLGCVEGIDPFALDAEIFDGQSLPL